MDPQNRLKNIGRELLDIYFKTNPYPYTSHHINSYDQFLEKDMALIIKSQNPILILKDLIPGTNQYTYRVEITVGQDTSGIYIGAPTVSLQDTDEVRLMYPAEARLRNLTYASTIYADINVKIIITSLVNGIPIAQEPIQIFEPRFALFKIPIMLHSKYCILNKKPRAFLEEVGECPYDNGGYFIIDGGERVLVTMQEQSFNTLYTNLQENDKDFSAYATITCFSPKTRITKRVSFAVDKRSGAIKVSIPFVRMPIPVFVLFRALGVQPDQDIIETIFPDMESPEAQLLLPLLVASVSDAYPYLTTYSAVQFMKTFTKGFTESHVLDIIHNQLFIHVEDVPGARVQTLGNYMRQLLRVVAGIDKPTDKDNTKNQRCQVSGFSTQMLFRSIYNLWIKSASLAIDSEYNYNTKLYQGANFANIFNSANLPRIFAQGYITDGLMRAFKGKWGTGLGEDKAGLIQVLSRLSYLDFMSHCRRVVLNFDTGLKLTGPRHLHPSQFGYFCTNETPGGSSIGITKNLSILTMISTGMALEPFVSWLRQRRFIYECSEVNARLRALYITVEVNGGIVGYTSQPERFVRVLQLFKRTGWLPPFVSIGFDRVRRTVFFYADEGRPLRPLVIVKNDSIPRQLFTVTTWRDAIIGTDPERINVGLDKSDFVDPLADVAVVTLDDYIRRLEPYEAPIEYVDPYEQNQAYIANFPNHIKRGMNYSHMEVHPSTMLGFVNSTIPFLNHNQSPRNQLGCSQSKQGLSLYTSNWKNRYDNQVHVLCYPQMPLVSTHYQRYLGEGRLNNGFNCIVAIATHAGYNQEDGIVMNADSIKRGMFRSICYRTYETFEENDKSARIRFGNPREIAGWNDVRPNLDYSKLDERGFIKVGEYITEETVIVGRYNFNAGVYKDASLTPQVWTRGRVDEVIVMIGANGLRLVKVRVVQDRSPEIGDKFTNRHGQKGTIGMFVRSDNLPRTADGVVPDLIMNPHAIPSRMTIAQLLEQILGKTASKMGYLGDGTAFSNEGSPADRLGNILEANGAERFGNEILYNGETGDQMPVQIFMCPLYNIRLKHMVEDKWNARGEGRREMRTHQPTGGRGNQGGLKIGELERDTLICHGITDFITESYMKRSDGTKLVICNGCGRFPIYNVKLGIKVCPNCDGPVNFVGDTSKTLEILPPIYQSRTTFSTVEAPYVMRLLSQEMETFMNMPIRFLTTKDIVKLKRPDIDPLIEGPSELPTLPDIMLQDERDLEYLEEEETKVEEGLEKPGAEEVGMPIPKEMVIETEMPVSIVNSKPAGYQVPEPEPPINSEDRIYENQQEQEEAQQFPPQFPQAQAPEQNLLMSEPLPIETYNRPELVQIQEAPQQFQPTTSFAEPVATQFASASAPLAPASAPLAEYMPPLFEPAGPLPPVPAQIPEAQVMAPAIPGAPTTFVVNTTMQQQRPPAPFGDFSGYNEEPQPSRRRSAPKQDESGQSMSPYAKVTVNKMG